MCIFYVFIVSYVACSYFVFYDFLFFFFKQKTAYEMRISDWSSDVCSSDLTDKIGVLVGLESTGDKGKLAELGRQIAMHIAATSPLASRRSESKIGRASCRERVCQYV